MATYKLTYFPCRARAELIRLVFAQAGVEYENVRLPFYPHGSAEWEAMKKSECIYNGKHASHCKIGFVSPAFATYMCVACYNYNIIIYT